MLQHLLVLFNVVLVPMGGETACVDLCVRSFGNYVNATSKPGYNKFIDDTIAFASLLRRIISGDEYGDEQWLRKLHNTGSTMNTSKLSLISSHMFINLTLVLLMIMSLSFNLHIFVLTIGTPGSRLIYLMMSCGPNKAHLLVPFLQISLMLHALPKCVLLSAALFVTIIQSPI